MAAWRAGYVETLYVQFAHSAVGTWLLFEVGQARRRRKDVYIRSLQV